MFVQILERGNYMDSLAIAGMSMQMQAASLQQVVGMSVMKKQMDSTQESAQALINMMSTSNQAMEKAVNPHLGARLNVLA